MITQSFDLNRLRYRAVSVLQPEPAVGILREGGEKAPTSRQLVDRLLREGVPAAMPYNGKAWCAEATSARSTQTFFKGFMRAERYSVDVSNVGRSQKLDVNALMARGHNCTLVAALAITPHGLPQVILKAGDARFARQLRGEPYLLIGFIGGRWDHADVSGPMIGIAEIGEEVGGKALEGGYWALGNRLSPTMPYESTESDMYRGAVIRLDGEAVGDGGGMELQGVQGPAPMDYREAFRAMQDGRVADGGRASVMYHRLFDSIGFIAELGVYAQDHPELQRHFDRLGLEAGPEVRSLTKEVATPPRKKEAGAPAETAAVDRAMFVRRNDIDLGGGENFVDADTAHATPSGKQVGQPFANQMLLLDYDRAKVAVYYVDPKQGPMVSLQPAARPLMAVKQLALDGERNCRDENNHLVTLDVPEIRVSRSQDASQQVAAALREAGIEGRPQQLGAKGGASTGQSDLYYHYYAVEVPRQQDDGSFVPLSDAIAACRAGEGDTHTEALCERLAGQMSWVPTLRMYKAEAAHLIG